MDQSALQPLPVDQLRHPDAAWLIAYWRRKSPDGEPPARHLFNGHETRAVSPHLVVIERSAESGAFRYATVGAAVVDRFRLDPAGMPLPPATRGGWSSLIWQAAEERRPTAGRGHLPGRQAAWVRFEIVALPFLGEHGRDVVVAGLFFFET